MPANVCRMPSYYCTTELFSNVTFRAVQYYWFTNILQYFGFQYVLQYVFPYCNILCFIPSNLNIRVQYLFFFRNSLALMKICFYSSCLLKFTILKANT